MKKVTKLIVLIIISLLIAGMLGCEKTNLANIEYNIQSESTMDVEDEWIYYISWKNSNIYRIKTDGTQKTKVSNDTSMYLDVDDGWIYYINKDDYLIYKIRTDGTEKECLTDLQYGGHTAYVMKVSGDWIYFINSNAKERLTRVKKDGSDLSVFGETVCLDFEIVDDWIYYTAMERDNTLGYAIYKIKTDGTEKQEIVDDGCLAMDYDDGWIYYNTQENNELYKIRIDGTNTTKLIENCGWKFNVYKGYVYYHDNFSDSICKIRTNGNDKSVILLDVNPMLIDIIGDKILIFDTGEPDIFMNDLDGTHKQSVNGILDVLKDLWER